MVSAAFWGVNVSPTPSMKQTLKLWQEQPQGPLWTSGPECDCETVMFPHRLRVTHFPRPGNQLDLFHLLSQKKLTSIPHLHPGPSFHEEPALEGAGLVMAIFQEDLQRPVQSHTETESQGWEGRGGAMRVGVHEHRVHGGWGEGGKASIYSLEEASLWPKFTSIQEDQSLSRFAQGSGKGHRAAFPLYQRSLQ